MLRCSKWRRPPLTNDNKNRRGVPIAADG